MLTIVCCFILVPSSYLYEFKVVNAQQPCRRFALRSTAKDVRRREAKRRLMDIDIKAGQPGTNLCRFTNTQTHWEAGKELTFGL